MITAFFSSKIYDGETIVRSLPSSKFIKIVDEWTEDSIIKKDNMKSKTLKYNNCVLFLEKDIVDQVRYSVKLDLHRNIYPSPNQDENVIFTRFTNEEKKIADKIIEKFCKASNMKPPCFTPKNGFSFYIFEKPLESEKTFIPQLLGLLRSYPSLCNATFSYGRKLNQSK